MAKVYIIKSPPLGEYPGTYSLYRIGTGPGRCEGQGFKTISEARTWAKKWGHEIYKVQVSYEKK